MKWPFLLSLIASLWISILLPASPSAADDSNATSKLAEPVSVIFDTDMDSDVDDVGALAVLHALANAGKVKILAIIVTSDDMHSPLCADAVNT